MSMIALPSLSDELDRLFAGEPVRATQTALPRGLASEVEEDDDDLFGDDDVSELDDDDELEVDEDDDDELEDDDFDSELDV
jgi:hypothetical protein